MYFRMLDAFKYFYKTLILSKKVIFQVKCTENTLHFHKVKKKLHISQLNRNMLIFQVLVELFNKRL